MVINLQTFREFFRWKSFGGILLISCVVIALIIANSPLSGSYEKLLATEFGYPVLTWINDGLMAIFFLLIGLEIKRELIEGELSSVKKAALPVFAAFGGAILPAILFYLINKNTASARGWGIPMATDIAFALAIISLLGNKVPASLKIFLAALAIVDDLIAILVIAIFYTEELRTNYLLFALAIFCLLMIFNRLKIKSLWFYLVPGVFIWYFIHHSGVHATIAGVLTALTIPTTKGAEESSLEKLEHHLHKPVNFIIMPLFALANTNISLADVSLSMLATNLSLGITVGLLLGKPIGIFFTSWLAVKLKLATMPANARWSHIIGVGILGGIGFTMSIFIGLLSFDYYHLHIISKLSILINSTIAGSIGYLFLRMQKKSTTISSR